MKNIIEYFYRLEVDRITYRNDKYYFFVGNVQYVWEECKNTQSLLFLPETQKYYPFHVVIPNVQGKILTDYENKQYILFRIQIEENRIITFQDVLQVAQLFTSFNAIPQWDLLWKKKVDLFESYIMNKEVSFEFREYYDYFIGLAENAITYYQYAKKTTVRYGFTYRRLSDQDTLYDLYDPLNIMISPVVRGVAEYVKSSFFHHQELDIEILESINLTDSETILFLSRMLFPTPFFDLCKTGKEENRKEMEQIINSACDYEQYLRKIFKSIKKRQKDLPFVKWLSS